MINPSEDLFPSIIPSDEPEARVTAVLEVLGARVDEIHEGGIHFTLEGIEGFARERDGRFRASFWIAFDPDHAEATAWIEVNRTAEHGSVELFVGDDYSAIRYLVEQPYENHLEIWAAIGIARDLHEAWPRNAAGMCRALPSAGLVIPPFGTIAEGEIQTLGAWHWASRTVSPMHLYMYDVELVATELIDGGSFFALAHAGHGLNSYALSLVTSAGPIAAFVQHGYGGVYTDPVRSRIAINVTYSRLHVLMEAAANLPAAGVRWLLTLSDYRMDLALIDLDAVRSGAPLADATRAFKKESDLFKAVANLPEFDGEDWNTAGSVSW